MTGFGAVALSAAALFFASCSNLEIGADAATWGDSERSEEVEERLANGPGARILVIGDSVMWWNEESGRSVAQELAKALSRPVINLSVPGARISHPDDNLAAEGLDIRAQYVPRNWNWVVVEGGANDLGDECGCAQCETTLNEMITVDASAGEWVDLVDRIRTDGANIVVAGYYSLPSQDSEEVLAQCEGVIGELNARLERLAAKHRTVHFVSMSDAIDPASLEDYDPDLIHPSPRGSRAIGGKIGAAIAADGP
ncbi:MAG: SGNH/GDSL hydrolase family protein [Pseudomonadota bacterium]